MGGRNVAELEHLQAVLMVLLDPFLLNRQLCLLDLHCPASFLLCPHQGKTLDSLEPLLLCLKLDLLAFETCNLGIGDPVDL